MAIYKFLKICSIGSSSINDLSYGKEPLMDGPVLKGRFEEKLNIFLDFCSESGPGLS